MDRITSIIERKNLQSFRNFIENLQDPNGYIVDDEENGTRLNLLHLIAGIETNRKNSQFIESCCRLILGGGGGSFDVNHVGSIERNYGITAAHIAVQWHNGTILQLLIDHECDLFLCDSYGQNVQDYAEREKNQSLIKIVESGIFRWFSKQPNCYLNKSDFYFNSNRPSNDDTIRGPPRFNIANYITDTEEEDEEDKSFQPETTVTSSAVSFCSNDSFGSISSNNCSPIVGLSPSEKRDNYNYSVIEMETFHSPVNQSYVVARLSTSPKKCFPEIIEINDDDDNNDVIPREEYQSFHQHNNSVEICENISYENSKESSIDSQATEIYIYNDSQNGVQLIEERYLGSQILQSVENTERQRYSPKQQQIKDQEEEEISIYVDSTESQNQNISAVVLDELIQKMTNVELYDEMRKFGENPGPINESTRQLYLKKYYQLKKQQQQSAVSPPDGAVYSSVANLVTNHFNQLNIRDNNNPYLNSDLDDSEQRLIDRLANYPLEFGNFVEKKFCFNEAIQLEQLLNQEFSDDNDVASVYGDGPKTYFVYLILDPEITDNLPARANGCLTGSPGDNVSLHLLNPALFASFILSIFYVGKGHSNRAYQHFYEAFQISASEQKTNMVPSKIPVAKTTTTPTGGVRRRSAQKLPDQICPKTERILRIWSRNKGPVSLHCFNGISSDEAFTREALMIEALSLSNLTNKIFGQFRCDLKLNRRQRNILGTYLLFKAFVFLILNGERQIRKGDNVR